MQQPKPTTGNFPQPFLEMESFSQSIEQYMNQIDVSSPMDVHGSPEKIEAEIAEILAQEQGGRVEKLIEDCKNNCIQNVVGRYAVGRVLFDSKLGENIKVGGQQLLMKDQDGGSVTTLHNAKGQVFASEEDRDRFNREYDPKAYHHGNKEYKKARCSMEKQAAEKTLTDVYNKQRELRLTQNEADEKGITPNKPGFDTEHIHSGKGLHDRDEIRLFMTEQESSALANIKENLGATNSSLNRSKGNRDLLGWCNSPCKSDPSKTNAEAYNINMEDAKQAYSRAGKIIQKEVTKRKVKYYASRTTITSVKAAATMGIQQVVGIFLEEFIRAVCDEIYDTWKNGFREQLDDSFFEALKKRLGKIAVRLKDKWKDAKTAFTDGALTGFFTNIVTVIVNMFKTTLRRFSRILREGALSLFRAVKMMVQRPEEMSGTEALHEASKLFVTGLIVSGGIAGEEVLEKAIATSLPFLAPMAGFISVTMLGLATGLTSAFVVYLIDKKDPFGAEKNKRSKILYSQMINSTEALIDDIVESGKMLEQMNAAARNDLEQAVSSGNTTKDILNSLESFQTGGPQASISESKSMKNNNELMKMDVNTDCLTNPSEYPGIVEDCTHILRMEPHEFEAVRDQGKWRRVESWVFPNNGTQKLETPEQLAVVQKKLMQVIKYFTDDAKETGALSRLVAGELSRQGEAINRIAKAQQQTSRRVGIVEEEVRAQRDILLQVHHDERMWSEDRKILLCKMMIIAARADGRIDKEEKNLITRKIKELELSSEATAIVQEYANTPLSIADEIKAIQEYEVRLILFRNMLGVLFVDGEFHPKEKRLAIAYARALRLNNSDVTPMVRSFLNTGKENFRQLVINVCCKGKLVDNPVKKAAKIAEKVDKQLLEEKENARNVFEKRKEIAAEMQRYCPSIAREFSQWYAEHVYIPIDERFQRLDDLAAKEQEGYDINLSDYIENLEVASITRDLQGHVDQCTDGLRTIVDEISKSVFLQARVTQRINHVSQQVKNEINGLANLQGQLEVVESEIWNIADGEASTGNKALKYGGAAVVLGAIGIGAMFAYNKYKEKGVNEKLAQLSDQWFELANKIYPERERAERQIRQHFNVFFKELFAEINSCLENIDDIDSLQNAYDRCASAMYFDDLPATA